ncbi:MAG: thiamine pyrophosphate-dependent dehydrogenase E1 component subunit alpha [Azospirillum sp.]|nr:thiamine pyrophosphate-dependent dehydrogenase E1 component subunit alpha [Azospirillum sp.]
MRADLSQRLLRDMIRIRAVEETIAARYGEGKMRCPTHLSIGQEAPAAAAAAVLRPTDLAVSGHRAHAHYLAKGGDLPAMIAEIYGKATGCARGKGGSMHLIDERVGFMGSTAIVGGTVPVGVGLALARALAGGDDIVCVFMGDAVVETGVFFEAANFAVVRRLPVLFLCENNLYSVYSPLSVRQPPGRSLQSVAAGLGLAASGGDGNDVRAAYGLIAAAADRLRSGNGPQFVELATYRWREHCGPHYDNDIGYRSIEEFEAWRRDDPIVRFREALLAEGTIDGAWLEATEAALAAEVLAAFAFAEASPFPEPEQAFRGLYAKPLGREAVSCR